MEEVEQYNAEQDSDFILLLKGLINNLIEDLNELCGEQLSKSINESLEQGQSENPKTRYNPIHLVELYKEKVIPSILQKIVKAGCERKVLKFLEKEVDKTTSQIKEKDWYVRPAAFVGEGEISAVLEERYWKSVIEPKQEEKELRIQKYYLVFLKELPKLLFVAKEKYKQPELSVSTQVSKPVEVSTPREELNNGLLNYDYTPQQVEDYFMQLANIRLHKEGPVGFYTPDQVMHFLKANFVGIAKKGEVIEIVKLPINPNLPQAHLMYFIFRFWRLQKNKKFSKMQACELLFNNYDYFNSGNISFETVYNSMGIKKGPKYPFIEDMLG